MRLSVAKFAHLTDIHLPIPIRPKISQAINKRALGYLSWRRRHSAHHEISAAKTIARVSVENSCQAALISGGMVNIALDAQREYDAP